MPGRHVKDLTGKKFGRLTVMWRTANRNLHACWACVCDCGGTTESGGDDLRLGRSKSCGCLKRELSAARMRVRA